MQWCIRVTTHHRKTVVGTTVDNLAKQECLQHHLARQSKEQALQHCSTGVGKAGREEGVFFPPSVALHRIKYVRGRS